MRDERLATLRKAILEAVSETPGGLTVPELEKKLRERNIDFWQGEVQEVTWRLAAARHLEITALGKIVKVKEALVS